MAALPKRKPSTHQQGRRRSRQKLAPPRPVICPKCGSEKLTHFACPTCGNWKKEASSDVQPKKGSPSSQKTKRG